MTLFVYPGPEVNLACFFYPGPEVNLLLFFTPGPRSISESVCEQFASPSAKKMRPAGSRFRARKLATIFGARKRSLRGQFNQGHGKWPRFLGPDSGHKNSPRGPPKNEAHQAKKWCPQKQKKAGRPVGRTAGRPVGRPARRSAADRLGSRPSGRSQ